MMKMMNTRKKRRKQQIDLSKQMRKRIEEKGLDYVVQSILDDSEMEDKEGSKEWLAKYVKRIAYG